MRPQEVLILRGVLCDKSCVQGAKEQQMFPIFPQHRCTHQDQVLEFINGLWSCGKKERMFAKFRRAVDH